MMRVQIINDIIVAWGVAITGADTFDAPDDYSPDLYDYTVVTPGVFNPNGFTLKPIDQTVVNFERRQNNLQQMNNYMAALVVAGSLTQANFDLFLNDTATNAQGYMSGGGRLITWIETVNRNGYNATTIGFKTRTAYRGTAVNGVYQRAEDILAILNDL